METEHDDKRDSRCGVYQSQVYQSLRLLHPLSPRSPYLVQAVLVSTQTFLPAILTPHNMYVQYVGPTPWNPHPRADVAISLKAHWK